VYAAALELLDANGVAGLGFLNVMMAPLPDEREMHRLFSAEAWPSIANDAPAAIVHRVSRPRGGNNRRLSLPFDDAIQQAVWDLYAKTAGMPLWRLLGSQRRTVRTYASGLDFHLSDDDYSAFFGKAAAAGFTAFKIKVGHAQVERDLHRLDLLKKAVGPDATIMIDANEAWTPKQAVRALELFRRAGHDIFWLEDPVLRNDFDGLKLLRGTAGPTLINSGEYLDVSGRRNLLQHGAADMLNVQGQITDVMRVGWLAADLGVPVTLGNSFLEVGVNIALALPEVEWLEYSFQNLDHLVEGTYEMRDGLIYGSEEPGHGLVLSETARRDWREPTARSTAASGSLTVT
jgi:L-alanine-DL-glutamate epimerase-like enolase superfamily enzyme